MLGTNNKRNIWLKALAFGIILLVVNTVLNRSLFRIDLTQEGRFSLTESSKDLLNSLEDDVIVEVLMDGDYPAGIQRFQTSIRDILEELKAQGNTNIEYYFEDPLVGKDEKQKADIQQQLFKKGLSPRRLVENEDGYSQKTFYPAALIYYKGRELPLILLDEQLNRGPQETINASIASLEYKFVNGLQKLARNTPDRIAFLEGHGELNEGEVADWAASLDVYYQMHRVNLTGATKVESKYDLLIIAKPTQAFNEADKFKIDQFIMNGGRVLWMFENLAVNMDSIQRSRGKHLATDYGLNLDDLLFKYGVRVNSNLIQDLQCASIPLTVGVDQTGKATQLKNFPWVYFPVIGSSNQNHPVSKNIGPILTQFTGSIDTIRTKGIDKTILLRSSEYCKSLFSPVSVDLQLVRNKPEPEQFAKGRLPVAVALEGSFTSNFKNRLSPSTMKLIDSNDLDFKEKSERSKMIVVSDGDIAKNDFDKKTMTPQPLGYYKFTGETFANKDFLNNAVEWLLDDKNIISAKSKNVQMRLLDTVKVKSEKTFWTWLNILLPLLLVLLGALLFNWYRKMKFTR